MEGQHGFTLVESLVALAVFGTLAGAGATALGDLVRSVQLHAFAAGLHQQLVLARSEAVKRNARVALCKSADGASCAPKGRWEQGALLFVDGNGNGAREPGEPVLQLLPPLPPGWRIEANGPLAQYVAYGPLGLAQLASGAFQAGTFTVCRTSTEAVEGRQVVINAGGRPRVQKARLESCY